MLLRLLLWRLFGTLAVLGGCALVAWFLGGGPGRLLRGRATQASAGQGSRGRLRAGVYSGQGSRHRSGVALGPSADRRRALDPTPGHRRHARSGARGCALACPAPTSLRANADRRLPWRPRQRGGRRGHVRGAAQAPAVPLVAPIAVRTGVGCVRGPSCARGERRRARRFAGGDLSGGTGADRRGGIAHRLSKLPAGARTTAAGASASDAAVEEALRVHQACKGARPHRARARTGDESAVDGVGGRWGRGVRAAGDDPHAGAVRAPREASVQAPRGAALARAQGPFGDTRSVAG